jgi:hypothetical protein
MNRELICTWLGLADKRWPPDPYALLGLTPEQCDAATIETRVQERMTRLRGYQLLHPLEATEGMTRVAQAYIVLVERHGSRPAPKPEPPPATAPTAPAPSVDPPSASESGKAPAVVKPRSLSDTAVVQQTQHDWQIAPPPVRGAVKAPLPAIPVGPAATPRSSAALEEATTAESEEQVIHGLAVASTAASSGLVTLQAVIERADLTRQFLVAWGKAGRYMANPRRKLTRAVEKADFSHRLEMLLESVESFPDFVAQPGRPGYRAVALAHLNITPEVFNAMGDEPREQLARDWALANKVLLAHRRYLLRQFKSLRRQGRLGRLSYILRLSFDNHPVFWTGLATAVGIAACVLLAIMIIG